MSTRNVEGGIKGGGGVMMSIRSRSQVAQLPPWLRLWGKAP